MAAQVTPFEAELFVLANGQTTSAAVALKNPARLGLLVPALTNGTLKLQISGDGGATFMDLHDTAGNALLSYAASTGAFALSSVDLAPCLSYTHLRVVTGAAQGADRTFTLCRVIERTDPLC